MPAHAEPLPSEAAPLGPAACEAFRADGFVVISGMLDRALVDRVTRWTMDLAAAPELPGRQMVYGEASLIDPERRLVQRIENFCPFHAGFRDLLEEGPLIAAAAQLFGEPAVMFKDKINFKMPGGDGFKPHQDQQAGWSRYASLFITALVAIDDATTENGCLEIAAGQHRRGLLGAEWKPLEPHEMADFTLVPLQTRAGDVVFFDSYVPHASSPNLSGGQRRVLYVTYNRAREGDHRERYFAEKRAAFPPDIEREPGRQYVFRV
ncbi:MAG: phytanoyl-CoA dioxygenase family protein [Alphaproteobacteria bacterium]|nr:phytanoyl-CoA dioxygenase family protein [Alphaproteobacteria bacterium]